jgi:hypothetical protein
VANVTIDLAAEYRGRPAFTKAGKDVSLLEKSVGKLGKQIASVFAAKKILEFGAATVKAFTEDQAAAQRLAKTVDNLGLAFANPEIAKFIDQLTIASGVSDTELRPALQKLITTTNSVTYAQDLLNQAIDISQGSGQSLETVVSDLSAAYSGNTKGIKKYATGLTAAQLKVMSFTDIMKSLNGQFSGANAAYLDTYAGKLGLLKNAAGEAQETLGKGLVDAFNILFTGGTGSIDGLISKMNTLSEGLANWWRGFAYYVNKLVTSAPVQALIKIVGFVGKKLGKAFGFDSLIQDVKNVIDKGAQLNKNSKDKPLTAAQQYALLQKDIKAKEKAAKVLAQKQAAIDKKNAMAKSVFDIDMIERVAALQGKLSDEERKRVEAQLALLAGNDALAQKLTNDILASQDATGKLSEFLRTLPDAKNPFQYLDAYLDSLKGKVDSLYPTLPNGNPAPTPTPIPSGNTQNMPQDYSGFALDPNGAGTAGSAAQFGASTPWAIQVMLDGKVLAEAMQNQSLSGNQTYINRRTGGFDF